MTKSQEKTEAMVPVPSKVGESLKAPVEKKPTLIDLLETAKEIDDAAQEKHARAEAAEQAARDQLNEATKAWDELFTALLDLLETQTSEAFRRSKLKGWLDKAGRR